MCDTHILINVLASRHNILIRSKTLRIEDSVNLLNKVFCNIHKEVQKIGHSLKSCLVPHFKNKCLFIQEYQIPIFEFVVLYLIGPLRKDSSL